MDYYVKLTNGRRAALYYRHREDGLYMRARDAILEAERPDGLSPAEAWHEARMVIGRLKRCKCPVTKVDNIIKELIERYRVFFQPDGRSCRLRTIEEARNSAMVVLACAAETRHPYSEFDGLDKKTQGLTCALSIIVVRLYALYPDSYHNLCINMRFRKET